VRNFVASATSFSVGNGLASIATYLLFLVFAYHSLPEVLGIFSLYAAITGIVVTAFDTITCQRVVQEEHLAQHSIEAAAGTVASFALTRHLMMAVIGFLLAFTNLIVTHDLLLTGTLLLFVLGQGVYAITNSTRSLGITSGLFVRSQAAFTLSSLLTATVFALLVDLGTSSEMLAAMGISRLVPGVAVVALDSRAKENREIYIRRFFKILFGKGQRASTSSLALLQLANAASGQADTLIAAVGGVQFAGRYQIAQRPMMALTIINISISQISLRQMIGSKSKLAPRHLLFFAVVISLWPTIGWLTSNFINLVSPPKFEVQALVFILLGAAYGVDAIASVTGPLLLLDGQERGMAIGGFLQLFVLLTLGLMLVSHFSLLGVAIAVLCAKGSVVVVHLTLLARKRKNRGQTSTAVQSGSF